MLGATSEEINSKIHWLFWSEAIGQVLRVILVYFMYLPYLQTVLIPLM